MNERPVGSRNVVFLRLLLVAVVAFIFVLTMAPDVMTDDSAEFQVRCPWIEPTHPPGYPLLLLVGKAFSQLPLSTVAWRLTLMSVVFGIAAVVLLYETLVLLLSSPWVAFATAVVFALSHTFWMESLLPEAYSLNACFNVLILYLLARYERIPSERGAILLAVCFLVAFAAGNHQVIVLMLPFYVLWLWKRGGAGCLTARRAGISLAAFAVGASIYLVLTMRMRSLWSSVDLALGGPSRGLLFAFTPVQVLKRFGVFLAYHAYQFPLIAGVVGLGGWLWALRRRRAWWALTTALWLITVAYALNFDSSDVYVFYIPAYIAFAIWVGFGFDALYRALDSRPASAASLLMISAMVLPPAFYGQTSRTLEEAGKSKLSRDKGLRYYLFPPKNHADWFGSRMRHLMGTAQDGGAVLVDWNYYFTALYLEKIEHYRREGKAQDRVGLQVRDVTRSNPKDLRPIVEIEKLAGEGVEHFYSPNESLAILTDSRWTRAYHTVGWYVGVDPYAAVRQARRRLGGEVSRTRLQNVWDYIKEKSARQRRSLFSDMEGHTFLARNIPKCRRLAKPVYFLAESDRLLRGQGVWMAVKNVRDLFPCDGWVTSGPVAPERLLEGKEIGIGLSFRLSGRQWRGRTTRGRSFSTRRPLHEYGGRFTIPIINFRFFRDEDNPYSLPVDLGQSFFANNTFYQYVIVPTDVLPGVYYPRLHLSMICEIEAGGGKRTIKTWSDARMMPFKLKILR